jgi:hypothetical protein
MLLAWGFAAPTSAHADCAYYVASKAHFAATDLDLLDHPFLAGTVAELANPTSAESSNKPARCPGGICSRSPLLPLAQAPAPTPLEQWMLLGCGPLIEDQKPFTVLSRDEFPRRDPQGVSIFHPPRRFCLILTP